MAFEYLQDAYSKKEYATAKKLAQNQDSMKDLFDAVNRFEYVLNNSYWASIEDFEKIEKEQEKAYERLEELIKIQEKKAYNLRIEHNNLESQKKALALYDELKSVKCYVSNYLSHSYFKQPYYYDEKIEECKKRIEALSPSTQINETTQQKKKNSSSDFGVYVATAIFILIIFFITMANSSKPKWSDLSDKEKANAEFAYEIKQYQKEYEKNNKKK